ncbi:MAG: acyl carrier protein [Nitrospiraceae bacterium]
MTHNRANVEEYVRGIIAELLELERDAVLPSSRLIEDLGADSLHRVELVMALEKAFNIEVSEDDAREFLSVQDVFNCVKRHTKL